MHLKNAFLNLVRDGRLLAPHLLFQDIGLQPLIRPLPAVLVVLLKNVEDSLQIGIVARSEPRNVDFLRFEHPSQTILNDALVDHNFDIIIS
jgi:hypothetical protein